MVWPVVKELLQYTLQIRGKEKGLAPLGVFPLRKSFMQCMLQKVNKKIKFYFLFYFSLLVVLWLLSRPLLCRKEIELVL